jgi:hypothetical protein
MMGFIILPDELRKMTEEEKKELRDAIDGLPEDAEYTVWVGWHRDEGGCNAEIRLH